MTGKQPGRTQKQDPRLHTSIRHTAVLIKCKEEQITYLGGMSDADNFEAARIFVNIASENGDEKYKSIALDFLYLLSLRGSLTKKLLKQQSSFEILYEDPRWLEINNRLVRKSGK